MRKMDVAGNKLDKPSQIRLSSCHSLLATNDDGTDLVEFEIHQASVRSEENGPPAINSQFRVTNHQRLAIGHFDDKRQKWLAMNQLDDFFFHLFGCHGLVLSGLFVACNYT